MVFQATRNGWSNQIDIIYGHVVNMHSWTTAVDYNDGRCQLTESRGISFLCTFTEVHSCPLVQRPAQCSTHCYESYTSIAVTVAHIKGYDFSKPLNFILLCLCYAHGQYLKMCGLLDYFQLDNDKKRKTSHILVSKEILFLYIYIYIYFFFFFFFFASP